MANFLDKLCRVGFGHLVILIHSINLRDPPHKSFTDDKVPFHRFHGDDQGLILFQKSDIYEQQPDFIAKMAGAAGFEPATCGFGDRRSTN